MDEILLVDKPAGMSSFGVVARVRRVLSERAGHKIKVGHTGTLDPFATGLLILLTGKNTKKSNDFLKLDKWYEATIRLGATSSTGDIEGEIMDCSNDLLRHASARPVFTGEQHSFSVATSERSQKIIATVPSLFNIEQCLEGFMGEIEQRVPQYSAVKINGQRAYKLAREGKKVEMPTRKVQIYQIDLVDYQWPELKIRCHVSSGTYIRTLGEDIGKKLGVGGYLTELRRTQIGDYKVEDATTLEDLGVV